MPRKSRKILRKSSLGFASLLFSALIVLGSLYVYIALTLPDVNQLRDAHLQVPLRVYTKDNKLIAEFGEKKRVPVTLAQVPPLLVQAILDTEDQRFYEHHGVDFVGLVRAALAVIQSGRKTQGASTITMQVARDYFLNPHKTYVRKINEILLAFKIDHNFSKKEILELYLNKIYFGQRAYGVAAASYVYFGKPLEQLTLPQMALIAGLPQAPSRNNPLSNPDAALDRRNHVLERMFECGHLSRAQYEAAVAAPLGASYHALQAEVEAPYLAEMVRNAMVAQFGDEVYDNGYKVYTTLDSHAQNAANTALRDGLLAYERRHGYRGAQGHVNGNMKRNLDDWLKRLRSIDAYGGLLPAIVVNAKDATVTALLSDGSIITIPPAGLKWATRGLSASNILSRGDLIRVRQQDGVWQLTQVPQIAGALVAVNAHNGAILSLVGGFSYAQSPFNRAVQADRQTGSSFKPFFYSAALAKGFTLASVVNDAPIAIVVPGTNIIWRPQNDKPRFYGPSRLRVALITSRNLASVRLLQAIGIPYAVDYVKHFGFDDSEIPALPSLALGVAAVSPLKLAAGYAVFANGGFRVNPYFMERIVDRDDKTIFQANPAQAISDDDAAAIAEAAKNHEPLAPRVITAQNAYLMTNALKDVIYYGTARRALALHRIDLAGKTGTTNDQFDAWFAGFNSDIVATAWVGYDKPKSTYEHGAEAALPIWMEYMDNLLAGKPPHSMARPDGITSARIDPRTGLLAHSGQKDAVFEIFTNDTLPKEETTDDDGDGTGMDNSFDADTDSIAKDNSGDPLF